MVEKKDTSDQKNEKNIKIYNFFNVEKLYAMKMLIKAEIEKRNQKIHTLAERQILENAKCPFIVQLHYAFQTEKKLYLVMDFMRGGGFLQRN